jgi:hypothetical protein
LLSIPEKPISDQSDAVAALCPKGSKKRTFRDRQGLKRYQYATLIEESLLREEVRIIVSRHEYQLLPSKKGHHSSFG